MAFLKGEYVVSTIDCYGLTKGNVYQILDIKKFTYASVGYGLPLRKSIMLTIKNDFDIVLQENIYYFEDMMNHRKAIIDEILD